ncbi:MAG: hypothetical protein SCK28_05450 [Bacillota bacterium]|nr:hypothetical protein [Bacillota bacterium]
MNASPLINANLSPAYEELKRKITEREHIGNHQFIKILKLHRSYPSNLVNEAIEMALVYQVYHYEGVKNILLKLLTPETKHQPLDLKDSPELGRIEVQTPQLSQFNQL